MGGQIMPPVMGAAAFIMAEALDVPYVEVVKAAIIPAMLDFASAFRIVHLEAGRRDRHGLPKAELPPPSGRYARTECCSSRWCSWSIRCSAGTRRSSRARWGSA